eukprot:3037727-Prymnesium_polylepis.1
MLLLRRPVLSDKADHRFEAIDLTAVHVLDGVLGVVASAKLDVRVALGQVDRLVDRELDALHRAKVAKDLAQVLGLDVSREVAHMEHGGLGLLVVPSARWRI